MTYRYILSVLICVCTVTMWQWWLSAEKENRVEGRSSMKLQSISFQEGGALDKVFTCDGENRSPEISWSGLPKETQSLVLICHDPDAPNGEFVHWVVYNIPPSVNGFEEGKDFKGTAALQGITSFDKKEYGGPCPPHGDKPHRYIFTLYALNTLLTVKNNPTKQEIVQAMQNHIIAETSIMGTYQRA